MSGPSSSENRGAVQEAAPSPFTGPSVPRETYDLLLKTHYDLEKKFIQNIKEHTRTKDKLDKLDKLLKAMTEMLTADRTWLVDVTADEDPAYKSAINAKKEDLPLLVNSDSYQWVSMRLKGEDICRAEVAAEALIEVEDLDEEVRDIIRQNDGELSVLERLFKAVGDEESSKLAKGAMIYNQT